MSEPLNGESREIPGGVEVFVNGVWYPMLNPSAKDARIAELENGMREISRRAQEGAVRLGELASEAGLLSEGVDKLTAEIANLKGLLRRTRPYVGSWREPADKELLASIDLALADKGTEAARVWSVEYMGALTDKPEGFGSGQFVPGKSKRLPVRPTDKASVSEGVADLNAFLDGDESRANVSAVMVPDKGDTK